MTPTTLIVMVAGVLTVACDGAPTHPSPLSPTPASAVVQPPPLGPPVNGDITLKAMAPPAGAVVEIWDCDGFSSNRNRTAHSTGLCTDRLDLTFDVTVDRDVASAILELVFDAGTAACGYGYGTAAPLMAGRFNEMRAAFVVLSEIPDLWEPCPLPVRATRVTVSLWETQHARRGQLLLTRSFDVDYTFAMR